MRPLVHRLYLEPPAVVLLDPIQREVGSSGTRGSAVPARAGGHSTRSTGLSFGDCADISEAPLGGPLGKVHPRGPVANGRAEPDIVASQVDHAGVRKLARSDRSMTSMNH